jgi:hypothetical protein
MAYSDAHAGRSDLEANPWYSGGPSDGHPTDGSPSGA